MTRCIVIANLHSGRTRRWLAPCLEACRRHGLEIVAIHFSLAPEALRHALDAAERRGISTVLVAGGDGTIGTVVRAIGEQRFTLGVLPTGTSNDLARSLDIPVSPRGAARVISGGRRLRVDVGEADGKLFCHVATVGINAAFAREAQRLRPVLGRLSYPLAALSVYLRRRPFAVSIRIDGEMRAFQAYEVAVVNAPVGGGPLDIEVVPAEMTDGSLDVIVVHRMDPLMIVRNLPAVLRGQMAAVQGLASFPARSVCISTELPMPVSLDGEELLNTPTQMGIRPRGLEVFVPAGFPAHRHDQPL